MAFVGIVQDTDDTRTQRDTAHTVHSEEIILLTASFSIWHYDSTSLLSAASSNGGTSTIRLVPREPHGVARVFSGDGIQALEMRRSFIGHKEDHGHEFPLLEKRHPSWHKLDTRRQRYETRMVNEYTILFNDFPRDENQEVQ